MCPEQAAALWTAVAAVGAVASVAVAAIYTATTVKLLRVQSDPRVIVYVRHDPERPSILMIVIENIGRDVARNVSFTSSRSIPARAFGLDENTAKDAEQMTDGPLIGGIPALGPGDRRDITWGQYGGLSKALAAGPIQLEYSYRCGKRRLSGSATLEVASYAATDASERPMVLAAKSLKSIAGDVEKIEKHLTRNRAAGPGGNDAPGA